MHHRSIFVLSLSIMQFSAGCGERALYDRSFGSVKDSVYHNEYFGMTVAIPPDWSVIDQEGRNEVCDFLVQMGAGDAKNHTATAEAAKLTSVNIFTVFKCPEGTPVPFNQNIVCVAQRVSSMPGILSAPQ